jgi:hypothetical protein
MKFELKIESDNAGMCRRSHVVEALRKLADKLEARGPSGRERVFGARIMDVNGNAVGEWTLTYT